MSEEKCEHVLDYEETHCTKCMKPTWQIAHESGLDRLEALEKKVDEISYIWNKFLVEKFKPLVEKITWLSDENATLYTQVDSDALKRANLGEQISELKEEVKILGNVEDGQWTEMYTIKEVLRELMRALWIRKNISEDTYKELKEKLDSPTLPDPYYACGKLKTEKKKSKSICKNCGLFLDNYPNCYGTNDCILKDSGGEKEATISGLGGNVGKSTMITNSKLPEPKDFYLGEKGFVAFNAKEAEPEKNIVSHMQEIDSLQNDIEWLRDDIRKLEKEKEFYRVEANKTQKELIEEFLVKFEYLRDRILEAPIISGSVQDLRDHIHLLRDLVIIIIVEYEGRLKK